MKIRTLLLGILVVQLVVGSLYTFAVPLWQAHEADYYNVVRFLAQNGRLPNAADFPDGDAEIRQVTQPPLWFLVAYPVVTRFHSDQPVTTNTLPTLICVGANDANAPVTSFPITREYIPPVSGVAAAGYALRLLNVILGMVGVVFTTLAGRALFPSRPAIALVAAALLAFEGSMVRLNSSVGNDTLLVTLGAMNLWCCALLARRFQWRTMALLFVSVALALLTRLGGWALLAFDIPFVLLIALFQARTAARSHVRALLLGGGVFVLLAGAVLVFNQSTYGSIFGRYSGLTDSISASLNTLKLPLVTVEGVLRLTYEAYQEPLQALQTRAVLGTLYGLLPALAFVGILWGALRATKDQRRSFAILFGMLLMAAALVIFRNALGATELNTTLYNTGLIFAPIRYYAAGLPALAQLFGAGLLALMPNRWTARRFNVPGVIVAGCWLLVSVVGGVLALRSQPAFPVISPADYAALSGLTTVESVQAPDAPTVLAYRVEQRPNDGLIDLTLYLTTEAPLLLNNVAEISLTDSPAPCQFLPARGTYPSTLWQPGEIIAASAVIPVCSLSDQPQTLALRWLGAAPDGRIVTEQAESLTLAALNSGFRTAASCPATLGTLAGGYQITAFNSPPTIRPGEIYLPSVNWLVLAPSADITGRRFSFRHDESGTTYTCENSPAPEYYAIARYERGEEVFFDSCALPFPPEAPPGVYKVYITALGADDVALPAETPDGQTVENGLLPVGSVTLVS